MNKKNLNELFLALQQGLKSFKDVLEWIETDYIAVPAAFKNGEVHNLADQNQGSAKVFSFARLHNLSEADTLALFAEHYQAVLATPAGSDHQNIRQFIRHGRGGVVFENDALIAR